MTRSSMQTLDVAAIVAALLAACGAPSSDGSPSGQSVTVAVDPGTALVAPGGSTQFAATVTGTADTSVLWDVVETGGGTVDSTGLYTAPGSAGTFHVRATSHAAPSVRGQGTVTVTAPPPPVVVTVTPSPAAVDSCGSMTFSATVTGTSNTAVTWSVQEGAAGGAITTAGVYTAPSSAGTYHVVATSAANASSTAVAAVAVADRVLSVVVSPQTVQVPPGGTAQFTATVTTTCGTAVAMGTVNALGQIVER